MDDRYLGPEDFKSATEGWRQEVVMFLRDSITLPEDQVKERYRALTEEGGRLLRHLDHPIENRRWLYRIFMQGCDFNRYMDALIGMKNKISILAEG